MVDLDAAWQFMVTHARTLDRRRLAYLLGEDTAAGVVGALGAYRNPDGGFGWALEPDMRGPASQPAGALTALEILEEVGAGADPIAGDMFDWLDSVTLSDGGLPFALAGAEQEASPVWAGADIFVSSLHMTAALCAAAHRVVVQDETLRSKAWLARATDHCLRSLERLAEPGHAYELKYVLRFLDAIVEKQPKVHPQLVRLGAFIPASGLMSVAGGTADEAMRPLDFAPLPDRPLRTLFDSQRIEEDLDRLAAEQQPDGGWDVDFLKTSTLSGFDWRGVATVLALQTLTTNGRFVVADHQVDAIGGGADTRN